MYAILFCIVSVISARNFLRSEIDCTICNFIGNFASPFVKQNESVSVILQQLQIACTSLPPGMGDACANQLNLYGMDIIQMLTDGSDPATACESLGLCPSPRLYKQPP